jgi:hypothetical protein
MLFSRASSTRGIALVLFAMSLPKAGAQVAPGLGLSRIPPTDASSPTVAIFIAHRCD